MIIDAERSQIVFSSGKEVYANNGIVGVSPSGNLSEGYDGGIDEDRLTKEEWEELCDYMSKFWLSIRNSKPTWKDS